MILEEETFKEFGYYPSELSLESHKKILAICDDCGKAKITSKNGYRTLCTSCANKGELNGFFGKRHIEATRQKMSDNHADCKGPNGGNWKGGLVTIKCDNCGNIIKKFPSHIKGKVHHFCNNKCWIEWSSTNEEDHQHHREMRMKQKNCPVHHTKPELVFEDICKKNNLPFKYTGDGSFWIGKNPSVNPDFVECNGKKIAVEVFGDYWHSPLLNQKLGERSTLNYRKKVLKQYGWKLIMFWETDLKRKDAEQFVLNKLKGI